MNETFFTISPLNGDLDPTYSELDFSEYLPNGGWGETGPINYQTTWYTYRADPWFADNVHSEQRRSFNGWHDLVVHVAGGHVKYYIDGVLVGDHSGKFYPRQTMTINWNLWFIDTAAHTGGRLRPAGRLGPVRQEPGADPGAVTAQAGLPLGGARSRTPSRLGRPVRDPLGLRLAVDVGVAVEVPVGVAVGLHPSGHQLLGRPGVVDRLGLHRGSDREAREEQVRRPQRPRVGQGKHLWRAKWWTQGSEPGWTANWEDLGHC